MAIPWEIGTRVRARRDGAPGTVAEIADIEVHRVTYWVAWDDGTYSPAKSPQLREL